VKLKSHGNILLVKPHFHIQSVSTSQAAWWLGPSLRVYRTA